MPETDKPIQGKVILPGEAGGFQAEEPVVDLGGLTSITTRKDNGSGSYTVTTEYSGENINAGLPGETDQEKWVRLRKAGRSTPGQIMG